jgi:membrane protease YdiL (CAAX protease family)
MKTTTRTRENMSVLNLYTPKHLSGRKPFAFFVLTFAFAWGILVPAKLIGLDEYGLAAYTPLAMISGFAPMAAAVTLVARRHGWQESWQFFRQAFDLKTKPVYLLLALLIPMAIIMVAHFLAQEVNLEVAETLFPQAVNPWLAFIPYVFFALLLGGGQEEFGWRGYAQQPLQQRFGITKASLLIGFIWGLWHLPLWFFPEGQGQYSAVAFVIHTTAVSVVYGLLYNASGQKLIVALLYHAMWNAVPALFPFLHQVEGKPQTAYWVYAGVTVVAGIIAAIIIHRRTGFQHRVEYAAQQAG